MKFFMQGMRRSATTVVYDLLSQDDRLDLYYEPYSVHGKVELGGGSGMQEIDHMAKIYETAGRVRRSPSRVRHRSGRPQLRRPPRCSPRTGHGDGSLGQRST